MKNVELVIFDWDATLVDSAGLIVSQFQAAIRDLNLPARRDEDISQLIGLGFADGMGQLFPEIETEKVLGLIREYRKRFAGTSPREAPLYPGTMDAIRELEARRFKLAVATGKSRKGLDRSLGHHTELAGLLATHRAADETANKPDPQMLTEILAELGLAPDQALMVGDTEYDAAMATAIGMPMVGVACGVHAPERILGAGAMAVIDSVAALPAWMEQRRTV